MFVEFKNQQHYDKYQAYILSKLRKSQKTVKTYLNGHNWFGNVLDLGICLSMSILCISVLSTKDPAQRKVYKMMCFKYFDQILVPIQL